MTEPSVEGLTAEERFATNAILDRPSADPDDNAAIAARAALRLAAQPAAEVIARHKEPHDCPREGPWSACDFNRWRR